LHQTINRTRAAAALPSVIGEPGVVNASVRAEQEPTKFLVLFYFMT
jgi:hypothetical protein